MKIIHAEDFGILPERDITEGLIKAIGYAGIIDGEKTLLFKEGRYYISSEKCLQKMLYITNTVGDDEFSPEEVPHLNRAAFYLSGVSDLVIDGADALFVIDGKVTNIASENCRNITFKNFEIRHAHPDMQELRVTDKGLFTVDFELDRDSFCKFERGKLCFYGKDFSYNALSKRNEGWIGLVREETPDKVERVRHPFFSALNIKKLGDRKIRVSYPNTSRFKTGDRFYVYDVRRQFAGIFINKCENVLLQGIKQRFNYSLAVVAQDSENITVDSVDFSPEENSSRLLASVADFIQMSMCRGKITVQNSRFCGAGDDCLNVHGIHFKITQKSEREITVAFKHSQTHGFNPLRQGDTVAFIDPETLLEKGRTRIINSCLMNEYEIRLTLESTEGAAVGEVIEDVSACPDLEFKNNTISRIITRGLLITTRGRVNVENNRFICTTMSGILLSDDAKNWYESGMCCDVTIKNNRFDYCGQVPILIKPENSRHQGAVHKNIKIIGNDFGENKGIMIEAASTDDIVIKDNRFASENYLKTTDCSGVIV